MELTEIIRGLRCRDPLQNPLGRLYQGNLHAAGRRHRRGLKSDISTPDDQRPRALGKGRGHRINVGERAHRMDAFQRPPDRPGQRARHGTGAQRKPVIGNRSSVNRYQPSRPVDGNDRAGGQKLYSILGVVAFRPQIETLQHHLAQKIFLGQWRALIWRDRLPTDKRQGPVMAKAAQPRREGRPGLSGTDDNNVAHPFGSRTGFPPEFPYIVEMTERNSRKGPVWR